jgi:hypothetical protein
VPLDRLDELWDFGDPAASERRFLALGSLAEQEDGGAQLAELLTQVARAPGLHVASTTSRPRRERRHDRDRERKVIHNRAIAHAVARVSHVEPRSATRCEGTHRPRGNASGLC